MFIGFKSIAPRMESQMEHEMDPVVILGFIGVVLRNPA